MKRQEPRLDQYGFPIPAGFDDLSPLGSPQAEALPGRPRRRWGLSLLKLALVAAMVALLWARFDLGSKFRAAAGQYHAQQAVARLRANDLDGALAQADRALSWNPDHAGLLWLRAQLRQEKGDYAAALVDVERALELDAADHQLYHLRGGLLHRLHQHREAAAAATQMLDRRIGDESTNLNSRAYARALGGFELNEALADIDRALKAEPENSSFLDTRGFVLFKLGRNQEALDDLNRAIALVDKERERFDQALAQRQQQEALQWARQKAMYDESLAVMYYHRGDVQEKLGRADEARKDRFIGRELGYNPDAGIY